MYAGQNKLLGGGRKEFECPNFDLDDADELSHALNLKNGVFCVSYGTVIFRISGWVREVRPIFMHIHLI